MESNVGDADLVVARVTSQRMNSPFDVMVADWQEAGLLLPSVVRLHKVATLDQTLVVKKLGSLSEKAMIQVRGTLARLWADLLL